MGHFHIVPDIFLSNVMTMHFDIKVTNFNPILYHTYVFVGGGGMIYIRPIYSDLTQ